MTVPYPPEAPRDCPLCPRLVEYRLENARRNPGWWNGAAPSFGDPDARLLVAGLAPGRTGANRTGRPFTGDHAGWLLYDTLLKAGFARGTYDPNGDDDLELVDCMITNAVRCAPPGNKPLPAEEATCRPFLQSRLAALPRLRVIVTLGDVSRRNVLKTLGRPASAMPAASIREDSSMPNAAALPSRTATSDQRSSQRAGSDMVGLTRIPLQLLP